MKRKTGDEDFNLDFVDVNLRVRAANEDEFEEAVSGGYSYGYLEANKLPVLARLGKEVKGKHFPFLEQYPQTRYKYFKNCNLEVAETDELLDKKNYLHVFVDVKIILIY